MFFCNYEKESLKDVGVGRRFLFEIRTQFTQTHAHKASFNSFIFTPNYSELSFGLFLDGGARVSWRGVGHAPGAFVWRGLELIQRTWWEIGGPQE